MFVRFVLCRLVYYLFTTTYLTSEKVFRRYRMRNEMIRDTLEEQHLRRLLKGGEYNCWDMCWEWEQIDY